MTKEVEKHIFEKFYQAGHSRSVCGNGLGLALVWQIASFWGGTISVLSQPYKGTTFIVSLPRP